MPRVNWPKDPQGAWRGYPRPEYPRFPPVRRQRAKVLVGRELAASPIVLMTAYAVRGLDINTSYTITNLLNEQKEKGVAVIYVGEDLDVCWSCVTVFWCCAAAKPTACWMPAPPPRKKLACA